MPLYLTEHAAETAWRNQEILYAVLFKMWC